MAPPPSVLEEPVGAQGQKTFSADREFDRKTKTLFHVFSPAQAGVNFSSNCISAETNIAAAINAVDEELFSQLTADNNGSELKSCTYSNKSKDGGETRLFTRFELYSERAVELFQKTFPPNRRQSNPAGDTSRQFFYSWPSLRRGPPARREKIFMALSIRGGQKLGPEALDTILSSAGISLCSTVPLRGHGFNTVSMHDSLAIIKGFGPPRTLTIGDKRIPFRLVTPVNPEVDPAGAGTSYAAAAAPATAKYQFQAWQAIEAARAQERNAETTDNMTSAPDAAHAPPAATAVDTNAAAGIGGDTEIIDAVEIDNAQLGDESDTSSESKQPNSAEESGDTEEKNDTNDGNKEAAAIEVESAAATDDGAEEPFQPVTRRSRRKPVTSTPHAETTPLKRKTRSSKSSPVSGGPLLKSPRKMLAALASPGRGLGTSLPQRTPRGKSLQNSFAALASGSTTPEAKKQQSPAQQQVETEVDPAAPELDYEATPSPEGDGGRKLPLATNEWARLQLDVVFIQEHHINGLVHESELGLHKRGWKSFWAFNNVASSSSSSASGSSTSGVLIAVKRHLITSGALQIAADSMKVWGPDDGRCLSINAEWGGHKLQLAAIYMPNTAAAQRTFIEDRLKPMYEAASQRLTLWAGDFNFVHNPNIDRLRKNTVTPGTIPGMHRPAETEHTVGKYWTQRLPLVTDVWRHRYPTGRMMTHFGGRSAARLDRLYIAKDGINYATAHSRAQRPRELTHGCYGCSIHTIHFIAGRSIGFP